MTRALVVGAGGAVGSAVVRHGAALGFEVHGLVRRADPGPRLAGVAATIHRGDVRDADGLEALIAATKPTLVVDAAFAPGHPRRLAERREMAASGVDSVLSLVSAVARAAPQARLVHLGSGLVYGGRAPIPGTLSPATFRGAVKATQSVLLQAVAKEQGVAAIELRLWSAYGPFEQLGRLVPSLLRAALGGPAVPIATRSTPRDWVYLEDVAKAVFAAATADLARTGPVVHVATGRRADALTVARLLEGITGRSLAAAEPYLEPEHAPKADSPPPEGALGWAPEWTLEAGLEASWTWAQTDAGRAYLLGDRR